MLTCLCCSCCCFISTPGHVRIRVTTASLNFPDALQIMVGVFRGVSSGCGAFCRCPIAQHTYGNTLHMHSCLNSNARTAATQHATNAHMHRNNNNTRRVSIKSSPRCPSFQGMRYVGGVARRPSCLCNRLADSSGCYAVKVLRKLPHHARL